MKTANRYKRVCAALGLLLVLMPFGCQTSVPVQKLKAAAAPYQSDAYRAALTRWTREGRIYKGFDVELIAAATLKTPAFRDAYTDEYGRLFHLTAVERENLRRDQQEAGQLFMEFVLAAYVPEAKWNDFNRPDSMWKLYLKVGEGELLRPLEIRKLRKGKATTRHFFPYATPWKSVYLVRFALGADASGQPPGGGSNPPVKLVIASVRGTAEMAWLPDAE